VKKIKELVDSDVIGDIYYFDSIRINLGLFQRDANVIWDLAPHDFSIMNYILNKKPVSLKAMGADHVGNGMENIAYVHVNFEDNLIAHFHLNWLSPVKLRKVLIGGSKKMIVFDDMENSEKVKLYDKGINIKTKEDEYQKLVNYRLGDSYSPAINNIEALKGVVDDFVNSIRNKTQPLSSGVEGLKTVQLLEASQKSIKNNGKLIYL
jgi:predicted dehydrogenase